MSDLRAPARSFLEPSEAVYRLVGILESRRGRCADRRGVELIREGERIDRATSTTFRSKFVLRIDGDLSTEPGELVIKAPRDRPRRKLVCKAASVALGTSVSHSDFVSFNHNAVTNSFFGEFTSGRSECEGGRGVWIYRDSELFNSTTTESDGAWETDRRGAPPGEYVARTARYPLLVPGPERTLELLTCEPAPPATLALE